MKIGSKLALYKLKLEYDGEKGKIYKATAIENFSVKTPYGNTWEQHFINNIIIYTNLELEIANFDIKLEPKTITKKDGSTFKIEQPTLSFERISNPKKSIIRVLDFEYKINNKRNAQGKIIYRPDKNAPYEYENWLIHNCEYDYAGWRLPEKVFEKQINYYKTQNNKLREIISDLRKIIKEYENNNNDKDTTLIDIDGETLSIPTFKNMDLI